MSGLGDYKERITVQRRSVTGQDAQGGDIISWTSASFRRWAKIKPLQGNETFRAGQTMALSRFDVRIPNHRGDNISTADRLLWGTRPLNIVAAPISEDRRDVLITAEEVD